MDLIIIVLRYEKNVALPLLLGKNGISEFKIVSIISISFITYFYQPSLDAFFVEIFI